MAASKGKAAKTRAKRPKGKKRRMCTDCQKEANLKVEKAKKGIVTAGIKYSDDELLSKIFYFSLSPPGANEVVPTSVSCVACGKKMPPSEAEPVISAAAAAAAAAGKGHSPARPRGVTCSDCGRQMLVPLEHVEALIRACKERSCTECGRPLEEQEEEYFVGTGNLDTGSTSPSYLTDWEAEQPKLPSSLKREARRVATGMISKPPMRRRGKNQPLQAWTAKKAKQDAKPLSTSTVEDAKKPRTTWSWSSHIYSDPAEYRRAGRSISEHEREKEKEEEGTDGASSGGESEGKKAKKTSKRSKRRRRRRKKKEGRKPGYLAVRDEGLRARGTTTDDEESNSSESDDQDKRRGRRRPRKRVRRRRRRLPVPRVKPAAHFVMASDETDADEDVRRSRVVIEGGGGGDVDDSDMSSASSSSPPADGGRRKCAPATTLMLVLASVPLVGILGTLVGSSSAPLGYFSPQLAVPAEARDLTAGRKMCIKDLAVAWVVASVVLHVASASIPLLRTA